MDHRDGDSNMSAGAAAAVFQVPNRFIQASQARQAKLKQQAEDRERDKQGSHSPPCSPQMNAMSPLLRKIQPGGNRVQPMGAAATAESTSGSGGNSRSSSSSNLYSESPKASRDNIAAADPAAPVKSGVSVNMNPSKAAQEVERLRLQREERRLRAAEQLQRKADLPEGERDIIEFKQIIQDFQSKLPELRGKSNIADGPSAQELADVRIRVCVRKRPLNDREINLNQFDIASTSTSHYPQGIVYIHEPKVRLNLSKDIDHHAFQFDTTFDTNASNRVVYQHTVAPLVQHLFRCPGARVTFFAYGQTGSGKTHTVFGPAPGAEVGPDDEGVYTYACRDLYARLKKQPEKLTIEVNFFEIYGGRVYDLFDSASGPQPVGPGGAAAARARAGRSKVTLLEDKRGEVKLVGLTTYEAESLEELLGLVALGNRMRTTGSTDANPLSSRSHAVFQMSIRKASPAGSGPLFGQFTLVDLAGSERGADTTHASRQARIEGAEINKSLLALKECIRALNRSQQGAGDDDTHIPFRASKLTQILRDSFIGSKARTVMVANIGPGSNSTEHTLNTLRYAARVKDFRKPVKNAKASTKSSSSLSAAANAANAANTSNAANAASASPQSSGSTAAKSKNSSQASSSATGAKASACNAPGALRNKSLNNLADASAEGRSQSEQNLLANQFDHDAEKDLEILCSTLEREISDDYDDNYDDEDHEEGSQENDVAGDDNENSEEEAEAANEEANEEDEEEEEEEQMAPTHDKATKKQQQTPANNKQQQHKNLNQKKHQDSEQKIAKRPKENANGKQQQEKLQQQQPVQQPKKSESSSKAKSNQPASTGKEPPAKLASSASRSAAGKVRNPQSAKKLLTLHRAVATIVDEEDELIQTHIEALDKSIDMAREEEELLSKVSGRDYDIDAYVEHLDKILVAKLDMLNKLKGKLNNFREHLKLEELASQNLEGVPFY